MTGPARARLARLLAAARRIADPDAALGARARELLYASSGLSPAGVELALRRSWEADASASSVEQLLRSVPQAPRAQVLLSANVFTADLRAIALGLAASSRVFVRPSRRQPDLAALLLEGSPGLFELVAELAPEPGDHVWAYGSDRTLTMLRAALPPGSVLHAHGTGIGVGVIQSREPAALAAAAAALAEDVVPFDQRGCLSPRVVFVEAERELASDFARRLAENLAELEARVPLGKLDPEEAADVTRYRDSAGFAGELLSAGSGWVSVGDGALLLPPIGRNLHVHVTRDLRPLLDQLAPLVTSVGVAPLAARAELGRLLPCARITALGCMQSPPFDGPVDRRAAWAGELIGTRRG